MLVVYMYLFLCIIPLYPVRNKTDSVQHVDELYNLVYSFEVNAFVIHTFSKLKMRNVLTNLFFIYCKLWHLRQTWLAKRWRCIIIPCGRGLRTHHNMFANLWPQFHFIDCRKSFVWIASKHRWLPCWTICTNGWHHCSQCVDDTEFVVMTTYGWPHRGRMGCGHAG